MINLIKKICDGVYHMLPFAWAIYLRFSTFTFKMVPWEELGEIPQNVFPTFFLKGSYFDMWLPFRAIQKQKQAPDNNNLASVYWKCQT